MKWRSTSEDITISNENPLICQSVKRGSVRAGSASKKVMLIAIRVLLKLPLDWKAKYGRRNCVRAWMKSKMGGESQRWEEKLCKGENEVKGGRRKPNMGGETV